MKIVFHPYSLKKNQKLNSRDNNLAQIGTLIKIIENENWGVADLCPKTELGDVPLAAEIKSKGNLYQRTIELAQEDLAARKQRVSLLRDKFVKNNFLITDYKTADFNQEIYIDQTVKIKADQDVLKLSKILNSVEISVQIRIDFNSILKNEEFDFFLNQLSDSAKNKIEYIEDPTYLCENWKKWNKIIPLAYDFQKGVYNSEFAKFQIVKPTRQCLPANLNCVTLTSAMEHPVGVAHGLRIAQNYAQNDSGFLTLDLYDCEKFNKYFLRETNFLNFAALARNDFGIGMSEELQQLNWLEYDQL